MSARDLLLGIDLGGSRAKPGHPRGTLEWEASKTAIARHVRKGIRRGRKSKLGKHVKGGGERLHSSDLADAFAAGDRLAVEAVERSARYVGIAIANLFDALAPELFLLGGGVSTALGRTYLALVRQSAQAHAFTTELGRIRIALSRLGDDAGLLGAALAARDRAKTGKSRRAAPRESRDGARGTPEGPPEEATVAP